MTTKKSQNEMVLEHLMTGRSITPLEAIGVYGIYRLAARVCELKKAGYVIESEVRRDKNKKPYARYFMPAFHRAAA